MKLFMVTFMNKDLPFHEHNRVYAQNHNEAIKTVRAYYGRGTVTIISVRIIMED